MDVIFEATRRCNLRCGHCLRGEPQSVDITKRVVWALVRLLSQLHNDEKSMYTGCVTMSGGEPTLNPSALEWWNTAVEGFQLSYGSFFVSTNGAQLTPRFLGSLFEAQMRSDADELYCLRLYRRGDGTGSLIPDRECPIWKDEPNETDHV